MLKPFADESTALEIRGLNVENRLDRVSLFGSLDLTRDKEGLAAARELRELVSNVAAELERLNDAGELPQTVETEKPELVDNPFN